MTSLHAVLKFLDIYELSLPSAQTALILTEYFVIGLKSVRVTNGESAVPITTFSLVQLSSCNFNS